MGRASIRDAAVLLLCLSLTPAAAADRQQPIELAAAARILGPHGLGVDLDRSARHLDPLHWAAINDQPGTVARLVRAGVPVDMRDGLGRTALMVAAAFGNAAAAKALIANGADPKATDSINHLEPLHFAAVAGRTEIAELLLAHGVGVNVRGPREETPLHYAALYGQRRMIRFLAESGADLDATDLNGIRPAQYAYRRRQDAGAELLLSLGARPDNLRDAVNAGDTRRVQLFLAHGSDVDARDESWSTPLDLAAATGQVAIAVMLLDAGADIEAADEPAEMHPLHLAALGNQPETVRLLIERGADLEAGDSQGRTPLTIAAAYGKVEAAAELLAKGANPVAEDTVYHDTPMHYAAIIGSVDIVDLLLSRGVDVDIRSGHNGESPLMYAVGDGQLRLIAFLIEHGADPNIMDFSGNTPVQCAMQRSAKAGIQIAALLRSLGARD